MSLKILINQPEGEKIGPQIGEVIRVLQIINNDPDDLSLIFDFSEMHFISPVLALSLAALITRLKSGGYDIQINDVQKGYLSTIYFPGGLNPDKQENWEEVLNRFEGKSYVPIINFPTAYTSAIIRNNVLDKVNSLIRSKLKLSLEEYEAVSYLISEMTDNITDHSGELRGWLFAQYYPASGFIDLCILDTGKTFLGAYKERNYPDITTHLQAIENATRGISTKGLERGHGIPSSREMITQGLKGNFVLISGNAMLVNEQLTEMPVTWNGSILALRIPQHVKDFDFYKYID